MAKRSRAAAAADAPAIQIPTRCRVIEFTDPHDGMICPAIVTQVQHPEPMADVADAAAGDPIDAEVQPITMNIIAFHPVMGPGNQFVQDVEGAARAEAGEAGTWNWPARTPA